MRANENPASRTYYRTAKGSHRHASYTCANNRRAIELGDVTELTAAEAAEWAACEVCCDDAEVAASAQAAAAKADAQCANGGVRRPKHIESECRDCGKRGKVDRRTGKLRPHRAA